MIARSMLDRAVRRALRETLLPIVETPEFQARLASELARQVLARHRQEPSPPPVVPADPVVAPRRGPSQPAAGARRKKLSDEDKRQARAMVEGGVSFRDVANRFQIAKSAMHRYSRIEGWAIPGNSQVAEEQANTAEPEAADPVAPEQPAQPLAVAREILYGATTFRPGMPASDDPVYLTDLAEARQHIKEGKGASWIAEEYGWELEHCQELCAAERAKA